MRQYPERVLTGEQAKIGGQPWPTRQIVCLVDKKDLQETIRRLSSLGQIDDIRGLAVSATTRSTQTETERRDIWDLHMFITYRELESSTSAVASQEFAETWIYTRSKTNNPQPHTSVAKLKHHDIEVPGLGLPPDIVSTFQNEPNPGPGISSLPLLTRTIQLINLATGQPINCTAGINTPVGYMVYSLWSDARREPRWGFTEEIENQTEWAAVIHEDWSEIYDFLPYFDAAKGTVTFESVRVALLVWERVRSAVRLSDGRVLKGVWALDPVLKDFYFEDGVRELWDGEEDEAEMAWRSGDRDISVEVEDPEESEEE